MFDKEFIQEVSDLVFDSLNDNNVLLEISYDDWEEELKGKEKYWNNVAYGNAAKTALFLPIGSLRRKYWERAKAAKDNASQLDAEHGLGQFERKRSERDLSLGKDAFDNNKTKISAGALVAAATLAAYKFFRNYSSKAKEACKNLSGVDRDICIAKYKIDALAKENQILNVQKSKCGISNDPTTCSQKLEEKIEKNNNEIQELKRRLASLSGEL